MGGQVQAAEIPHQIPENNWMLAEELVRVYNLNGWNPNITPLSTADSCQVKQAVI